MLMEDNPNLLWVVGKESSLQPSCTFEKRHGPHTFYKG